MTDKLRWHHWVVVGLGLLTLLVWLVRGRIGGGHWVALVLGLDVLWLWWSLGGDDA